MQAKKYSMAEQVHMASLALNDDVRVVTVEGKQMAKIGEQILDEQKMDEFFQGLLKELKDRGYELTPKGLGRVFRP